MIPLSQTTKLVEKKGNAASFEIEALYPGYGVTIGNTLRRVLLSSMEGAAATQVKIKGASHEFSTIPGVLEDVITILLNLKQMRFKMHGEGPIRAILQVKGEKEIKGSHFKLPPEGELINQDVHIATLTAKTAELDLELQIEKGVGYVPAEERKQGKKEEIGVIALDAIFTPVSRVSFKVENMRVGERTDFDKISLQIETDGTITPEDSLWRAAEILRSQFELIGQGVKPEEKVKVEKPVKKTASTAVRRRGGKKKL
ncbi:MAG: DNA-directed RNA polymerase subunit alpha [Parcubacteria group bacterium Greene0714_21]|nr:MAG: DNA-directed RNA polymerase subunit alpha [Parcubacteria group bacterium Greene0416_39]TSC97730.1 MAG: DNA-directed RNA polymerase subunit alpha [Parcubacteria group bacterium Greene1014_47]TSD04347.1 MAG: DNA-directed RNA polymerase subunit alpha [Parcubacteria group bacterium Greene0714_21]